MDLFYQGSFKDQIRLIKKDIKDLGKAQGLRYQNTFSLLWGSNLDAVGNNIFIVTPPYPGGKYYKDKYTLRLLDVLKNRGFSNYFISYCYHQPTNKVSRKNIKEYSTWIQKLVEITMPKLIVCLGEESVFSFFKRKTILRDYHGKEIDKFNGIPVMITFSMDYYTERSEYEDVNYKDFLLSNDWSKIKEKYNEVIK